MNEKDFLYTLKEYLKTDEREDILNLMKNCELSFNYTSVFATKSYQYRAYIDIRVPIVMIKKLKEFKAVLNKYCGEIFIEDEQYAFYGVDIKPLMIKKPIDIEKKETEDKVKVNNIFKICKYTIEAVSQTITGDNGKSFYRKGYELVEFFNQLGSSDIYGTDFPSRIDYARKKVKQINLKGNIDELFQLLVDPREYIENEDMLVNMVEYLNKYLKYDGYILVKDLEFYKLERVKEVNNNESKIVCNVKDGQIPKQDLSVKKEIKLFFSYSHKDEAMKDELEKHLIMLKRQGVISTWHDRKIDAGSTIDTEIDANLKEADIILLLISVDFLVSDYCYDIEMKEALEMHKNKQAIVVPVILRSCDWTSAPFSKLLALPTDAKSVSTWADQDTAFLNIAKGIKNIATKI